MQLPDNSMQNVGQISSHNTSQNYSAWRDAFDYANSVELDVWPLSNWIVSHDFASEAGNLEDYMKELYTWKQDRKEHDLITVFIEIKSREGWRVDDFESILLQKFKPEDMFRPSDLIKWSGAQAGSSIHWLRDIVKLYGWPKFSDEIVKDKIMFVINGDNHVTDTYLAERSHGPVNTLKGKLPLCFMMSKIDHDRSGYQNIVILNEEYKDWEGNTLSVPENCLRRAYTVKKGNDEMVKGRLSVAKKQMKNQKINYLCYDDVKNAFAFTF